MIATVPDTDQELSLPPERLISQLQARGGSLTMLPAVAMHALQLANDPDSSVIAFARLVQQDQKLASDILALANSPLYTNGRPTSNVQTAAQRLGFRKCKSLIMTSSMSSLMKKLTFDEQWTRDILWRHSFLTAIVSHHLNKLFNTRFDGEEFSAGLIHDLGRTLLAVAAGKEFIEADPLNFEEDDSTLEREQAVLGTDHTQFGGWFARKSNLPADLISAVECHHQSEETSLLTALVTTADDMANHLQQYREPDQYSLSRNAGVVQLERLGVRNAKEILADNQVRIMDESAAELAELVKRLN